MKESDFRYDELRTRMNMGKQEVFDPVRKKYVTLTAEEGVRQNFIRFLVSRKNVPASLLAVETSIRYNRLSKRCDIVVFSRNGKPVLIVECKAREIKIDQLVFQQVAMYNFTLKVKYLVVTNGSETFTCMVDHEKGSFQFLDEVPDFEELNRE
jgi:type I site-specific restriction-modification system R (restriction) subunit